MNIISMAFRVSEAVAAYTERVRRFYYQVMLLGHGCPRCSAGLRMTGEGRCRCIGCGNEFDPTVAFQRCSECGGTPRVEIRRYRCRRCGQDIVSRFLFDGLVFDAAYFRQKMAESRTRRQEQKERRQLQLIDYRSPALDAGPVELGSVAGLAEALNLLVAGAAIDPEPFIRQGFDLSRYESHIQAHLDPFSISFDEIPPLSDDARLDRIWRFVAIIFMAHAGLIKIEQDGPEIMVMHREAD
ncbi:MAG: hypothetical protein PVI86_18750 [Phycisphaerae bacterium]|jgi:hypothetical protein